MAASRGFRPLGALLAAVLVAATATACSRTHADDDDDDPPGARAPTAGAGSPRSATSPKTCGWIPPDAVEVTPVSSFPTDGASDPVCNETASTLDVPKAVAVSIERQIREATKMSDEEEARIGRKLEASLPRERSLAGKLDRPEDVARYRGYLKDIVQNIASKSTRPDIRYRIHVVRSSTFNAAALPGGVLLVFTGMLEGREAVRSEAELAGVLAHEITHVERRHVVAAYQFAKAALGDASDESVLAMRVLTQPLSTEHELEADERGMELMTMAGYDPQAVANLWKRHANAEDRGQRRRRRSRDMVSDVLEGVGELLRSHPPSNVRACHALTKLAWAREHAPCDRLYDGRSNLAAHVAGPRQAF